MGATRRGTDSKAERQRRERRASFAEHTPKAVKRALGVTTTTDTPLHVRALGFELESFDREYARERARFKLAKFGMWITRASIRFDDVSGPTGAPTFECRIKVVLRNAPDVVVTWQARTPRAAFDGAIASGERAVRRALEKKPAASKKARRRR
ncbi:MAG: hypothetical protein ABS52_14095 [Gemmatimonadetes bacterium SCN 70-22]|mgnify:FL=1|nr:MAG: hypothetical protein ABS52_14095 [Gemmatimonadetes bacterium SCN 70-22]